MATSKRSRVSDFVVNKTLGIDTRERYSKQPTDLGSRARDILDPAEICLEDEPTVADFLRQLRPSGAGVAKYLWELFPFASWLARYNRRWLLGDVIAGITVGLVVVPQAVAYASLANLPASVGLYTSISGLASYWLVGTSRDVVIGTTAVGSLLVGQAVSQVNQVAPDQYDDIQIANVMSVLIGAVLLFFGLLRLGWIIEFIPYIPISAFVTGASITIMSTQIPKALGVPGVETQDAPYRVLVNTLKGLPNAQLDAAIGISTIVLLFAIRNFCSMMEARQPVQRRVWSTLSSLRLTFVMLLFTLISFLVNRNLATKDYKFEAVGYIEPGLPYARVPRLDTKLLGLVLPQVPAPAIILVIEHIAIAKSMGRRHGYAISSSQETVALGVANVFSPFIGGYACTGSFGASAVLSKAGVRTPLAGIFGGIIVVLTLYALAAVFNYIPEAALAGLIIHAVYNLITPPKNLHKYWQLSPIELFIWIVGVLLAVFVSLEVSIYTGAGLSIAVLLVRLARTRGRFLGKVRAHFVVGEKDQQEGGWDSTYSSVTKVEDSGRDVFFPLDRKDATNKKIGVETPYPGVFVYRFNESYNYTNQAFHLDTLQSYVRENTKPATEEHYEKESDRLWNDPGPRVYKCDPKELPYLRAIVLDCAAINNLDVTSIQGLIDLRNTLDRYATPDAVEWHFANVYNPWARRALAVAGFGYPTSQNPAALGYWKPLYSIATMLTGDGDDSEVRNRPEVKADSDEERQNGVKTPERSSQDTVRTPTASEKEAPGPEMASISGVDRPFFHIDLREAVESAVTDAESKDEKPYL